MRILIVTVEYPPHSGGGILKYYALLAKAWAAAGAEVSVLVATPFSEFPDYDDQGVPVSFVPLEQVNRHANALAHLATAPMYRRWIAAGLAAADYVGRHGDRFDVIETTDFGLLFAPLIGLQDRPPIAVTFHGSVGQIAQHEPVTPANALDGALARLTEAAFLPHADGLRGYSPANAAFWAQQLGRDVPFVPPPFPLPVPPDVPRARARSAVAVGRIQTWKGPELLCRAFELLGKEAPADLVVNWVGRDTPSAAGGQSMSAWLATTYPSIWQNRVVPVGTRTSEEVAALQTAARFVVVPSLWDTFNLALTEGMGLGCVSVGSTGAGASYLIEDRVNGLRCDPDPRSLAEALLRAHTLSDRDRREMGERARDTVARELDPATSAHASMAALAGVQRQRRADRPGPWLRGFLEPMSDLSVGVGHLDNVAIRDLAGHLKTRIARKILGGAR